MKTYNRIVLIMALGGLLMLTGCSTPPTKPVPPTIVTEYKTVEVYVHKPCDAPMPNCDFKGDGFEPTVRLLECVVKLKRTVEYCKK